MKFKRVLVSIFVAFTVFHNTSVYAEDELYLCGIVKILDIPKAFVTVDVKSESCQGLQKFELITGLKMSSINLDQKICFFIDRNQCMSGYIYSITKIEKD
jgi:hypothetical protein